MTDTPAGGGQAGAALRMGINACAMGGRRMRREPQRGGREDASTRTADTPAGGGRADTPAGGGQAGAMLYYCADGNTSVAFIQVTPLGHFTRVSMTTPIASALKHYYR
jgi:hypothetical protein